MSNDIENLIRSARPRVDAALREQTIASTGASFTVPSVPTPWLQIAAALVLALAGGFVASAWFAGPLPGSDAGLSHSISQIEARIEFLNSRTELRLNDIQPRLEQLNRAARQLPEIDTNVDAWAGPIAQAVRERAQVRQQQRVDQQRESHLAYARKRYERQMERSLAAARREYSISQSKEAELRVVFVEHGERVQALISANYRGRSHSMSEEFKQIQRETEQRVSALLADVPRNLPGADLSEWGPNPDSEDVNDFDSWLRWNTEIRRAG